MPPHRKVPFSNKQKKEQLKAKRERKHNQQQQPQENDDDVLVSRGRELSNNDVAGVAIQRINQQPSSRTNDEINRYRLHFQTDSSEDVANGRRESRKPLNQISEECMEMGVDDVYPSDDGLDMPKRPPWDYSMSRSDLEDREMTYFKQYLTGVFDKYGKNRQLSYFELNLETWRQLWRVLEMSDVIIFITDIRCPAIHFSPALYNHVINELKRHLVLVLNKIDLVPAELVTAWRHYFMDRYPQLKIVCFTSRPSDLKPNTDASKVSLRRRQVTKRFNAVGPRQLLETCEQLAAGSVELDSWRTKIEADSSLDDGADECRVPQVLEADSDEHEQPPRTMFERGILTLGCCGYPNVGKSSLINGLMGRKVVSVSRTPGHTKHFQTIFLTHNVRLCDSPGLVFPSLVHRPLQVLAGMYPLAQLREPYSAIKFLAERLPLVRMLQLRHADEGGIWTAYSICEAWAIKRGFLTAKAARPDIYRAANNILRMASEGRLCLYFRPPGYFHNREFWANHSDTLELTSLLHITSVGGAAGTEVDDEDDDDDDDDGEMSDDGECSDVSSQNPFALLSDD